MALKETLVSVGTKSFYHVHACWCTASSWSSYVFCFGHSDVLSVATALDDFIAPDCRFINIRKGQMVYVYSKLVPEEGSGVFWSGSVRV